jgi:uncharacterized membrane protein (UPF0127 family)
VKKLLDLDTGEVILGRLEIADTFWRRFVGLQFRPQLPANSGLMISPCSSLHTCFMRFPIDVIMLDKSNKVIGFRRELKPWRILLCPRGTSRVVETNVGAVSVAVGIRLKES